MTIEKSIDFAGRKLVLKTGDLALQANSSCLASYGDTVVLATLVSAPLKEKLDYFPLYVEYRERLSAGGRIKGSRWVKREGRPTDDEVLKGRLIDRSIRPLFPPEYEKEVQVTVTVLSVDPEGSPEFVAGVATSAAIACSSIPWAGPVSLLRVGLKDNRYFINPTDSEVEFSDMEVFVATIKNAVVMIEASAREVKEEEMVGGISHALVEGRKLIEFIEDFAKEVGTKKEALQKTNTREDKEVEKVVKKLVGGDLDELIFKMAQKEGEKELEEFKKSISENFSQEDEKTKALAFFEKILKERVRENILMKGKRPDGRGLDQIRPVSCTVGVLPRTHGSAIFQRGQTQALTVATLGAPSLEQLIETPEGEETKRYIHHYSMPPFSTGEVGKLGFPSRREIGHGALAERALLPVIPSEDEFPYTIYLLTEILSSNGSTSMASVCGSTLALMDAGVPIKKPVAGIAMGLVVEDDKKFAILTDIIGLEDRCGDMDFKVAGTYEGITALQLDVKTLNLTPAILGAALSKAKIARFKILDIMRKTIASPREKVSAHAPKIKVIKAPEDKIGEIIGPGGKNIRKVIMETGAQVEIEDDGKVNISGLSQESVDKAVKMIESMIKEVKPGEIYDGLVKRIQPFGAFVEILPGKEGLVHVSDMTGGFVKDPSSILSLGQRVQVRVKEIDNLGRINLSMILDPLADEVKEKGIVYKTRRRFSAKGLKKGPHFPLTRLTKKRNFS